MMKNKLTCRLPEKLVQRLDALAESTGKNRNELITEACGMYCDMQTLNEPGSYLPQWVVQQVDGICGVLQNNLNNRSNQLLSSMAIQLTVIQMILADGLKITNADVSEYTVQAVEALKGNNRVFRMEEFLKK